MDSRTKNILWFGISTAIILAMIYFADVGRFIEAVQTAKLVYLIPAFLFGLIVFPIWSYTWYEIFQSMGMGISFMKSVRLFMSGNFFNSVTPLGQFGGEPFMAYIISKNSENDSGKAFSAVFSADIINAVPTFTFVIAGAIFQILFGSLNEIVVQIIYIAVLTTMLGGSIVYLLWFKAGRIESGIIRLIYYITDKIRYGRSMAEKIEKKLLNAQEAFAEVGESPRTLFKTTAVAHLGFLAQVFCLAFILLSLEHSFNFTPLYFTIALASLANFSPTPGGSGTYEAAMASLLTLFLQMSFASALVAAILFRMTTYWPGILIGYIGFNTLENGMAE